jgi:hypothetical protein
MMDGLEQPESPSLIVSVESRKGGVGKTTAALCLGRILRRQGYAVLLLDMDVTGTNAADIAASPFWSSDLHVIRQRPTNDNEVNTERPANLLALFDECFMTGRAVPAFVGASPNALGLSVDLHRVNVFGSQIYKTEDQQSAKVKGSNRGLTCLERPSVLFDDLHTLWLLDFIQHLISDFCRVVRTSDTPNRIAVIIDNSPGYVGIAPAIHEWLTDSGPVVGKFMIVTSLDAQDLHACGRAVEAVHGLYRTKWETSRLFLSACEAGGGFSLAREQESFFLRLATTRSASDTSSDQLAFFRPGPRSLRESEGIDGKTVVDAPWRYIGLLVNRVPRAVKRGHLAYEFPSDSANALNSVVQTPPHDEGIPKWREHMVSYDEYIENQFLLQSLQRGRRRPERRLHILRATIDHAIERLSREMDGPDSDIAPLGVDGVNLGRLRTRLITCNELVSRARSALDDAGLGHLARLIHDEWLPGSIVPFFRNTLSSLLRESEFPFFEMMPFELDSGPVNPEAQEFVMDIKKHVLMEIRESTDTAGELDNGVVGSLSSVLASLASLSLTFPMWHTPLRKELVGLLAGVLSIELRHWKQRSDGRSSKHGVQRFLAQETVKHSEIEKDLMMSTRFRFFRHHMMRGEGESGFSDFYAACTSSQARLIDFVADSQFLLRLMQFMVSEKMDRHILFPFVRGLAEDVIERKTVRHEEAPARMAKGMQSAEYFGEFDRVLSQVLRNWGIANG